MVGLGTSGSLSGRRISVIDGTAASLGGGRDRRHQGEITGGIMLPIRRKIPEYFSALLPFGPKTSVPSGTLIRSLSFRASSRYVFPSKDNVLDPTDCRKWEEGRRIKTEGMVKSVKRLRKNLGVLGVRNRILSVASGKWRWCTREKDQAVAAAIARGCGGGRRTCLHLFQRAQRWVVTSRVGRHGNLLGLPKRGSIVLPVKTARDPDPTGSPMHMDSQSRRVVRRGGGEGVERERGRGDSTSLERKSSVPPPLKSFVIIERQDGSTDRPRDNVSYRDALETRAESAILDTQIYNTRHGSAPCCRGGGRLEPMQRRLVTLATREGVVFGVETREGGPAKTTLLYVLARTCTGGAEGACCTCNGFSLSSTIELFTVKRELTSGQLPASRKSGGEVDKPRQFEAIGRNMTSGMAPAGDIKKKV
ncbi:Uncharacterized protein DBV15_05517, partial [Temnothorax longispinosus]